MSDKDAPAGWHWGIGESGSGTYTHWMYSDETWDVEDRSAPDNADEWGYEIQQYWDEGNDHTVLAYKMYYDEDGDIIHDERVGRAKADSKEAATQEAISIAQKLL